MLNRITPTPAVDQQRVTVEQLLRLDSQQTQKHENLKVMIEERNLEIIREVRAIARNNPSASPLRRFPAPTDSSSFDTIGPMRILRANDMKTQTIEHYCDLVDNLLACVDFEDYSINSEVRTRVRNDIVEVHKRETRYLEGIYGTEDLKDAMTGKYWKLAGMDGERYPLARAMHNQSSSSLSELSKGTAALEIAKVAETIDAKPSDARRSNTCPGDSMFGGPKDAGAESSPQLLREEVGPFREAPPGPEVSVTRLSASPKRVNSERLEAIDSTQSVPVNRSQPDGTTREHSEWADPYQKAQRRKMATAKHLDNCAVKILDQETESTEEMVEEVDSKTVLMKLSQAGISKRSAWGGVRYIEKTDPLCRASIPLRNAHQKQPNSKSDSFTHSGTAPLPDHAKNREPSVPLKEVSEIPQQAAKSRSPIANAQSLPLNYAMEVFLNNRWENPVTQKEAPGAGMPAPAWYEAISPGGPGTSMMITQSSRTRESVSTSQDLPGLTISTKSSASSHGGLSLAEDSDTDTVTILASDRDYSAEDDEGTLECPFNQLGCLQIFVDSKEWVTHSLTHFGSAGPPPINRCTFCEERFYSFDAAQSWSERMNHVALHHRLGNKLTGARWDNTVYMYTHMYENGLLGIEFLYEYLGRERDRRNAINAVNSGA